MKQHLLISLLLIQNTAYLYAMEGTTLTDMRTMLINSIVPDILPQKRSQETYSLCINAKNEHIARKKQDEIVLTTNSFAPFASRIPLQEDVEYMQWHNNLLIVKTLESLYLYNTSKISLRPPSTITATEYSGNSIISSVGDALALQIDDNIYVNYSQDIDIIDAYGTIQVSEIFDEDIKEKTISALCLHPSLHPSDQNILALGTSDGIVYIWDIQKEEKLTTIDTTCNAPITSLYYSPNGKFLAALINKSIFIGSISNHQGTTTALSTEIHPSLPACWSHDNKYFTVILNNGTGLVWNANTQQYIRLKDIPAPITAICWSPESNYLALGLQDGTIYIWAPHIKTCIKTLSGNDSPIKELHWPKGCKELRAIHKNGTEYQWNTERLSSFEVLHCKTTSALLYYKLIKKDFSYYGPYAARLGLFVGTGYGLYYWITKTTGMIQSLTE